MEDIVIIMEKQVEGVVQIVLIVEVLVITVFVITILVVHTVMVMEERDVLVGTIQLILVLVGIRQFMVNVNLIYGSNKSW